MVASPRLLILYTEIIMGDVKMGGTVINNIRYVDDTVIISLRKSTAITVVEESKETGLLLNSAMSFTMAFSESDVISTCDITVHGSRLNQVTNSFT